MTDGNAVWSCTDVLSRIYEFIDGELGAAADECVRAHLRACAHCRPAFEHERVFLRIISERSRIESCPADLRRRIIESFMAQHEGA